MNKKNALLLTAAMTTMLAVAGVADARNADRVRSRTQFHETGAAHLRSAQIRVEREHLGNQKIVVRLNGAPAGELTVFLADAAGAMRSVAALTPHGRSGKAMWEVRTARGDALPFGVPDVADLSGRAIEVRSGDGTVLLTGVMPAVAKASGMPRKMKTLRTGLAVGDGPAADGVEARVEVRHHHGAEDLRIKVEGAAAGLTLEAWLVDTDGTWAKLGELGSDDSGTGSGDDGPGHDAGDDHGADDPAHDANDDHGAHDGNRHGGRKSAVRHSSGTEYELDVDPAAGLPFGALTLADLGGLALEIHDAADGSVLASGFLPNTSVPQIPSGGHHGGHGTDDGPNHH